MRQVIDRCEGCGVELQDGDRLAWCLRCSATTPRREIEDLRAELRDMAEVLEDLAKQRSQLQRQVAELEAALERVQERVGELPRYYGESRYLGECVELDRVLEIVDEAVLS